MGIKEDIQKSFKEGTTLTKLIYINLGVFVVIKLIVVILTLFNIGLDLTKFLMSHNLISIPRGPIEHSSWTRLLMLPAEFGMILRTPWTFISYMFFHEGFIHILFNILMLYWFGRLFLSFFSQKDLVGLYLIGGFLGGVFYILAYHTFPYFADNIAGSYLHGASASVMAIIVAVAVTSPNHLIRLLFFGEVQLKWIAFAAVIISLLRANSDNAGGEIAHLGGAVAGYIFAVRYKKGSNITAWVNGMLDKLVDLFKRKPKMRVTHQRPMTDQEYNLRKRQENENIDRILEKIKRGGYESLSKEEKQALFHASQR